MKYINKFFFALLFGICALSFLSAFETDIRGEVEFNIRFYNRQVYYSQSSPIFIQVTITNNSPLPYRFKLADDRVFSVDFDIRSMQNRQLPQADNLIRKRTQYNHVFFREISIESGESFSFVEDLRDYVNFSQSGSYRIQARVYPELYRSSIAYVMDSNYLTLSLRPELIIDQDGIPLELDVATGAVLVRQKLSPDEVVSYMLTARQQSQWERFFLYMDLEAMLSRDALQKRKWTAENEEGRRKMVADYRVNLQKAAIDGDISVIPNEFDILRTVYNNNEGSVTALLKFKMINYNELRRYTYYLEKRDDYWIIVNYTVDTSWTESQ